jgi:protein gp37
MAAETLVEWSDATWPIVQGCDYESPGCTHCYAVPLVWRMAHHPNPTISAPLQGVVAKNARGKLHFTGKVALRDDRLDWPLKWGEPRKIFVPSHGDLFHPAVPDEFIDRVYAVMAMCPSHTFQVLTKRTRRMRDYIGGAAERVWDAVCAAPDEWRVPRMDGSPLLPALAAQGAVWGGERPWPLRNVWAGTSIEDQVRADERIPPLLETLAVIRFLSAEPLLGPVDLRGWETHDWRPAEPGEIVPRVDWVIGGFESGKDARGGLRAWARSLRDQCGAADVAFFWKQNGEWIDADEWLDKLSGKIMWSPPRPLSFSDASAMAAASGRPRSHVEHQSDGTTLIRVGKKAAGRLLDRREHSEFPA